MVKQEGNLTPSNLYGGGLRRARALFALVFVLTLSGIAHARGERDIALFPVEESGKWGFVDREGKVRIDPQYEEVGAFSEGLARVDLSEEELRSRWGYIDKTGKVVIPAQFPEAGEFSEGLAAAKTNVTYGYIDHSGEIAAKAKFDKAESFSEGLAKVKVAGRYGYIDKSGQFAIEPKLEEAEPFENGLARVKKDGHWGYIDRQGISIWQAEQKIRSSEGPAPAGRPVSCLCKSGLQRCDGDLFAPPWRICLTGTPYAYYFFSAAESTLIPNGK